jgi:5-methyltetrahydropteroyltriglutamate--homocysteine methyltransferase
MLMSTDRILVSHVGSLPRAERLADLLIRQEAGETIDTAALAREVETATAYVTGKQVDAGVDVGNDGEQSRVSFQTYVPRCLCGFGGESKRPPARDQVEFPSWVRQTAMRFPHSARVINAPAAQSDVQYVNSAPINEDAARLKRMGGKFSECFMTAPSPGIVATTMLNQHYDSHEAYLMALAKALSHEYRAIHDAGLILQIDAPDLAMGRHTMYRNRSLEEFEALAARHIDVLNHALRNVPADRVRMHVCWGNYEGPHHHDVPMERLLPIVLKAKPQGLLFEAANPRHAHEWVVFRDTKIPDDKILIPGVLATTTNYIEHPLLVAERLEKYADIVGRDRVIAGTDCGFGTFAGFGPVEPDIVYMKLESLVQGARIASERLWRTGHSVPAA